VFSVIFYDIMALHIIMQVFTMSFAKVVKRPEEYNYYVLTVIVYKHISSCFRLLFFLGKLSYFCISRYSAPYPPGLLSTFILNETT